MPPCTGTIRAATIQCRRQNGQITGTSPTAVVAMGTFNNGILGNPYPLDGGMTPRATADDRGTITI